MQVIKPNKKNDRAARKAERLAKLMEMSNEIEAALTRHMSDHHRITEEHDVEEGWEEAWANRVK